MSDVFNKFMVGMQGDHVVFLKPLPPRLSAEDARLLAAWLVAMAGDWDKFKAVYDEVCST